MVKNIDDFLSGLVEGSTHIISSPKTLEDLQKRGVKFDKKPAKTEDEFLDELFDNRRKAAISLSAVLVEFSLKHAIVRKTRGNTYDKDEWDRIENMELGPTIAEAKSLKIINNKQEEALKSFKNMVRNPYLHYNIKKITKRVAADNVKKIDVITQKVEELDIPAEDNPVLWGFAKKFVDRETIFDVFAFADKIVKELFEKKR